MSLSKVQIFVLVIAVLGGWFLKTNFFIVRNQEGQEYQDSLKRVQEDSMTRFVYKYEEETGGLDMDNKYGIDCILALRRTLTYMKCIYVVIGTDQIRIEQMLGEKLVTDRNYRLELLHNIDAEEGKHFKIMRMELYPELLNALEKGTTQEIWRLTEMFIDSIHLYSAQLLAYGGRMKSGIENAKATGKLESLSLELTRKLAFMAGAEKCVIEEWYKLTEIMLNYLDWVGNRLHLQPKTIKDKKLILNNLLDRAHVSGSYANKYVSEIGVTNLTSKHDIWYQKRQGEEMIDTTVEVVLKEKDVVYKSNELFVVFGFTTEFDFNSERLVEKNKCAFEVVSV